MAARVTGNGRPRCFKKTWKGRPLRMVLLKKQRGHLSRLAGRHNKAKSIRLVGAKMVPRALGERFAPEAQQIVSKQSEWSKLVDAGKATPATPATTAAGSPTTLAMPSPADSLFDASTTTSTLEPGNFIEGISNLKTTPMKTPPLESANFKMVSANVFIDGLECILRERVAATCSATGEMQDETPFHAVRMPKISLKDYLRRIHEYLYFNQLGDESFVLALVYMHRLPRITWCELNVHRLTFVAIMVAAKMHSDEPYKNSYYAKVAGLTIGELNGLEALFLKMLEWQTFVGPEEYQLYYDRVCNATNQQEPL